VSSLDLNDLVRANRKPFIDPRSKGMKSLRSLGDLGHLDNLFPDTVLP
jgi:hypothetical protein